MQMEIRLNGQEEKIALEKVTPEDLESIQEIIKNARLEIYPNKEFGITRGDIEAVDFFNSARMEKLKKEVLDKKDTMHWMVLKNKEGKVIGSCKAVKQKNGEGEIQAMYVVPEIKGTGEAQKLMEDALAWLGDRDVKLQVVNYNYRAIKFYERYGFKKYRDVSATEGRPLPSGKIVPRIEMMRQGGESKEN